MSIVRNSVNIAYDYASDFAIMMPARYLFAGSAVFDLAKLGQHCIPYALSKHFVIQYSKIENPILLATVLVVVGLSVGFFITAGSLTIGSFALGFGFGFLHSLARKGCWHATGTTPRNLLSRVTSGYIMTNREYYNFKTGRVNSL